MTRPILVLSATLMATTSTWAQDSVEDPAASLNFWRSVPDYSGCESFDRVALDDCTDLVSEPIAGDAYVWLVLSRVGGFSEDGVYAVEFSIEYSGVDAQAFSGCGGGAFDDDWPASGSWASMDFNFSECEVDTEAIPIGFFYVTAGDEGTMAFGEHGAWGAARYLSCEGPPYQDICAINQATVDLSQPITPRCVASCDATPVATGSWGAVKAAYDDATAP